MKDIRFTAGSAPVTCDFDVIICGGGMAGLTLARQLRREQPRARVAVVDRLTRPLPEAAFKIGESTVELAGYYLRDMLGLADYLDRAHLRKLGIRMYFPPANGDDTDFASRPEVGLSMFATVPAHQIDRGRFEQDLREMIVDDGVTLIEGARIDAVTLGEAGAPHILSFYHGADEQPTRLTGRWVVDAAGRQRMLQRQPGLGHRREADHNAVWFRVDGRVDVEDLVPAANRAWHDRTPGNKRWFATSHLVGKGYWVWIIPLKGDRTSIGIVADSNLHPIEGYQSMDRARAWLAQREPALARRLEDFAIMDFGLIRNYSHTSHRVISADRWACTGDAGVFADPLYAPGADLIAFANSCISWLVGQDLDGRLTPEMADEKSRFIISLAELLTRSIQTNYHLLGSAQAMGTKLFWDFTAGWAVVQPLMFGKGFLDTRAHAEVRAATRQFFFLSLQMNQMFLDWAERGGARAGYDFIDYLTVDAIRDMRARNLIPNKPIPDLIADARENMGLMEELALAIFRIAVADVLPDRLEQIEGKWLNPCAISLDPATWEERGLFRPRTAPRDTAHMTEQLGQLFGVPVRVPA
ncbi:MAG: tryptophan 7-halogenase [Rhodobacterales bacterium]|nr:tryptophan 7-halogenase [Rhodobacterales bacterium]